MKWVPRQMESAKKKSDTEDVDDWDANECEDLYNLSMSKYAQRQPQT